MRCIATELQGKTTPTTFPNLQETLPNLIKTISWGPLSTVLDYLPLIDIFQLLCVNKIYNTLLTKKYIPIKADHIFKDYHKTWKLAMLVDKVMKRISQGRFTLFSYIGTRNRFAMEQYEIFRFQETCNEIEKKEQITLTDVEKLSSCSKKLKQNFVDALSDTSTTILNQVQIDDASYNKMLRQSQMQITATFILLPTPDNQTLGPFFRELDNSFPHPRPFFTIVTKFFPCERANEDRQSLPKLENDGGIISRFEFNDLTQLREGEVTTFFYRGEGKTTLIRAKCAQLKYTDEIYGWSKPVPFETALNNVLFTCSALHPPPVR